MAGVLNSLWLTFWRLLPGNPILVRVVYGASRRTRHFWLRLGYLIALAGFVLISLTVSLSGQNTSLAELAKGASQTFQGASIVQLAMMCFLAPVFTAAAITQERDASTFNILLTTPLSSAQIVFGSLLSRLYFVVALLLAGLPIFLITMVYGGVTTSQVMESFALSGATALLTGSLAIFVAMMNVGTRRTIFSFYLMIGLYLLSLYLLANWDKTWIASSPATIAGRKMSWLTPLHPFLALEVSLNRVNAPPISQLMDRSLLIRLALAYPAFIYILWTLIAATILTVMSMFFVRRGSKTGEQTWLSKLGRAFKRNENGGERTRHARTVWHNPVAWREAKTRASGGSLLRWTIIGAGLFGSILLAIYHAYGALPVDDLRNWLSALIMIQFALALLIATNTAATSMTKEREARTLDILMTTPLTSRYILWGKIRGLVSFAIPMLIGPVFVLLGLGFYGILASTSPPAVWIETGFLVGALMVIYTAAVCILALHISLTSRTNVTAVMYSLGVVILVCGIVSGIDFAIIESAGEEFGAFFAPFTPFTAIRFLVDPAALFGSAKEFAGGATRARMAVMIGCLVAGSLFAFIIWSAYSSLVRGFDMTMRKQTGAQ